MNVRKFSLYVLLLGIVVAGYGTLTFASNQPVQAKASHGDGFMDAITNMGGQLDAMSQNQTRKDKRSGALVTMFVGGVIVLMAFGMRASSKE